MEDYQKRVCAESDELDAKIVKLSAYLFKPNVAIAQGDELRNRSVLLSQLTAMLDYSEILHFRISKF